MKKLVSVFILFQLASTGVHAGLKEKIEKKGITAADADAHMQKLQDRRARAVASGKADPARLEKLDRKIRNTQKVQNYFSGGGSSSAGVGAVKSRRR